MDEQPRPPVPTDHLSTLDVPPPVFGGPLPPLPAPPAPVPNPAPGPPTPPGPPGWPAAFEAPARPQPAGSPAVYATPAHGPPMAVPHRPPGVTEPPRPWSGKRIAVLVIGLVLAGLLGLVGIGALTVRFAVGLAENSVPADAGIGDCFGPNGSKQSVPCDGAHSYQVFSAVYYAPDVDYPAFYVKYFGNQVCDDDFQRVTGASPLASDYDYVEVYPTEARWQAGDRVAVCALHRDDHGPIGHLFSG